MSGSIMLILGIICAFVGARIGAVIFLKPIKIEFKVSLFDSFMFAFCMFFIINMVMALELTANQLILSLPKPTHWLSVLLKCAINNGLFVAIALPVLSIIFGKWAKGINLDLCSLYSVNFIKIYYSLSILANCIWLLILVWPSIVNGDSGVQNVCNRVIIWMLSIGGTWFGIGFHCEGRVVEELENIRISKQKRNKREVLRFVFGSTIAFLINCLLLFVQVFKIVLLQRIFLMVYMFIMSGSVGLLFSVVILKYIENPTENRSNLKLSKAISRMHEEASVSERYQTIHYSLMEKGSKKYMLIHEGNVIWPGHEDEIIRCFGERKIPLEDFEYKKCHDYLTRLKADRNTFVQKGYLACREAAREQLIDQNQV